jgi:hypothetical protein
VGKVSDFIVLCSFSSRKKLVIIELKSKVPHVLDCLEKIENICGSIEEFIEKKSLQNFDFYPLILSKSMGPTETKLLLGLRRVKVGKCSSKIIREKCDISLDYLFGNYP